MLLEDVWVLKLDEAKVLDWLSEVEPELLLLDVLWVVDEELRELLLLETVNRLVDDELKLPFDWLDDREELEDLEELEELEDVEDELLLLLDDEEELLLLLLLLLLDEDVPDRVVVGVGLDDEAVLDCDELVLEGNELAPLPVCADTVDDDVDRVEEVVVVVVIRVDDFAAAAATAELER